jgi:hypothetical protein
VAVNDGARLTLDGRVPIDALDNVVAEPATHASFTAAAHFTAAAGRLYPLLVEYRENTGAASLALLYSSASQPLQLVPSDRLFAAATTPIAGSPFSVRPTGSAPSSPSAVAIAKAGDSSATVAWAPPASSGGLPVTQYRVEWYTNTSSSGAEVQSVLVSGSASDVFTLALPGYGGPTPPLKVTSSAAAMATALNAAYTGAGTITVACMDSSAPPPTPPATTTSPAPQLTTLAPQWPMRATQ